MKKLFILTLSLMAVAVQAQDCSDLFISEYLEGSGNNKGLEIYNPTPDFINLQGYYVARYSNGKNTYLDGGITALEGFIQGYGTHFIVNGQTVTNEFSPAVDPALQALAQQLDGDYPAPTYMNGNDAIALFKDLGGSGDPADFKVLDLFGIIGGGMTSDDEGWAAFTNEWVYRNDSTSANGKDSVYINNYIVPEGYYWIPWTSGHALVRKPNVKRGVYIEEAPTVEFVVTQQWDTVPGGMDVWDSLNNHFCECQFPSSAAEKMIVKRFSIYPNPSRGALTISNEQGMERVEIYSMSGQLMRRMEDLHGTFVNHMDVDELPDGVYTLRLYGDAYSETHKWIKQE